MRVLDSLRKGFRFFLMSFGISSSAKKPPASPQPKPRPWQPRNRPAHLLTCNFRSFH